jgi:hypothetical protein
MISSHVNPSNVRICSDAKREAINLNRYDNDTKMRFTVPKALTK